MWDLESGKPIHRLQEHNGGVLALAFSPDGKTFASGADDQSILLWDVATNQPKRRFSGHDSGVTALAFSPDGRTLASASADRSIRLWRIDTLDELLAWTKANRYIPQLTCDKQQVYQLADLSCVDSASAGKAQ
jgi:WD40 repeat protein